MQDYNLGKKELVFWLVLGVSFVAALALLAFFVLKGVNSDFPVEENNLQEKPVINTVNKEPEKQTEPSGNKTIIQESDTKSNIVFYRSGLFVPKEIKVENNDGGGSCFITILNESDKNLEIRLSPHKNEGDLGPRYDLVIPQGNLVLDPRFRIPEIAFHNHSLPFAEFKVILGKGCTLD